MIYIYDYVYNIYICIIYPILILVPSSPIDSIDPSICVHLYICPSIYASVHLFS